MDENNPPLTITQLVKLTDLGIPQDQITWSRVSMTSDKWICIRHDNDGKQSKSQGKHVNKFLVTIFAPFSNQMSQTWGAKADSILMNPLLPIVALKVNKKFDVFDVETHTLLRSTELGYDIVYWTWVSDCVIGLITEHAVYHWSFKSETDQPVQVFRRHSRLNYAEITNYQTDTSMKWCALTGLFPEDNSICGLTQLYYTENRISQCIPAHAITFTNYKFGWNSFSSQVMCVATRDSQYAKFHVVELGPHNPSNMALTSPCDTVPFPDLSEKYDFPVHVHASCHFGLIYVITKYGRLFICDLETASVLITIPIATSIVFTATLNQLTQGIMAITTQGRVLCADLKKDLMVKFVRDVAKKPIVADRLQKMFVSESQLF